MDTVLLVFTIFFHFTTVFSDKYGILPPIYKIEDYRSCMERSDSYCKVDISLINSGHENNPLWSLINDSINEKYRYDRNVIHRAICVPRNESFSLESIKNFSALHINEEFKETNLLGIVKDISCTTKDKVNMPTYDKFILLFFITYSSLIAYATIKDNHKRIFKTEGIKDKIITSLSLTSNWKKVWKIGGSQDFNKLKSIQGIRFYNMLIVIGTHTVLAFGLLYVSNPEEIEKLFAHSLMQPYLSVITLVVQPFFLISSWILTFQIYNIHKDHGKFTVRDAFILLINRFFRIGLCSTVMILLLASSWYKIFDGPLTFDMTRFAQESCKRNGWLTFCFIHNFLLFGEMCHPSTWYLGVDFQLYIATLVTMYLILKYKLNEWKVISLLIVFSYILYGSIIHFNDMTVVTKINVNVIRKYNLFQSNEMRLLYTLPYSSWTVSLVGILMGIIYTKNKHRNINNNKIISIFWLLTFFGLPITAIYIAGNDVKGGIQAAVLGALVKPLYCLGIGIGILGMSHNIGGPIRSLCENKYVVMMSNFSYTAYIFQFPVVFLKGVGSYSLAVFDPVKVIKYYLFFDTPVSILLGIICTLIFEQPGINLQKMLLPQIERKKQKSEKDQ